MSVSLPCDELIQIKQLVSHFVTEATYNVMIHQVMSFLGKTTFCGSGTCTTLPVVPCHSE